MWQLSDPIRIVIPGPPRPWERAGHRIIAPKGKRAFVGSYTPTATRNEQSVVRQIAHMAMAGMPPIEGPVDLRFAAFMPVPASWSNRKRAAALADRIRPTPKPDFDNLLKLASDAFKEIVWRDDSQVTDQAFWKRYSDQPRLVIEVRAMRLAEVA